MNEKQLVSHEPWSLEIWLFLKYIPFQRTPAHRLFTFSLIGYNICRYMITTTIICFSVYFREGHAATLGVPSLF